MAVTIEHQEREEIMLETLTSTMMTSDAITTMSDNDKKAVMDLLRGDNDKGFGDISDTTTASLISDNSMSSEDSFRLHYYTRAEIQRHNTEASAWIVAGEDIYDVTDYIEHHPGGKYSIMKKIGGVVDCTQDLMYHSKSGQKYWKQFLVGKVTRTLSKNKLPVEKEWWRFWD